MNVSGTVIKATQGMEVGTKVRVTDVHGHGEEHCVTVVLNGFEVFCCLPEYLDLGEEGLEYGFWRLEVSGEDKLRALDY